MLGFVADLLLRIGIIGVEKDRDIFMELMGSCGMVSGRGSGGIVCTSSSGLGRLPFELSLYDSNAASNFFKTCSPFDRLV